MGTNKPIVVGVLAYPPQIRHYDTAVEAVEVHVFSVFVLVSPEIPPFPQRVMVNGRQFRGHAEQLRAGKTETGNRSVN